MYTAATWPRKVCLNVPSMPDQSFTELSKEALAMCSPEGEKVTWLTCLAWPRRRVRGLMVRFWDGDVEVGSCEEREGGMFQRKMVLSSDAETRRSVCMPFRVQAVLKRDWARRLSGGGWYGGAGKSGIVVACLKDVVG